MPITDLVKYDRTSWAGWGDDTAIQRRWESSLKPIAVDSLSKRQALPVTIHRLSDGKYDAQVIVLKNCDLTDLWKASEAKMELFGFTVDAVPDLITEGTYLCGSIALKSLWSKGLPITNEIPCSDLTHLVSYVGSMKQEENPSAIEEEFYRLANTWYQETGMISMIHKKSMHPAYQRIIGMGKEALPFIFKEIQKKKGHWFWALCAITGEDPAESTQKFSEAVDAWISWGEEHGYL